MLLVSPGNLMHANARSKGHTEETNTVVLSPTSQPVSSSGFNTSALPTYSPPSSHCHPHSSLRVPISVHSHLPFLGSLPFFSLSFPRGRAALGSAEKWRASEHPRLPRLRQLPLAKRAMPAGGECEREGTEVWRLGL